MTVYSLHRVFVSGTIVQKGRQNEKRRDGRSYILKPETSAKSPLDVEGVDIGNPLQRLLLLSGKVEKEQSTKGRLKNYSSVSPLTEKETRCLGILSVKCPVFWGLLPKAYAKLFLYDP